jgi:metalloprotein, YbeY/UPF0054 family
MIRFYSENISFELKNKRLISKWLKEVAAGSSAQIGDLNYIFCSDDYLLDINKQFLGHDYYTDIITFDNSDDYALEKGREAVSGDIYISIDTVRHNGAEYGEGFDREIHRVIAHGLLHLIGFDDTSDELQAEMTEQENKALSLLAEMTEQK